MLNIVGLQSTCYCDFKPAYTKGTFLATLENSLCETGSGASPPTPPKTAQRKIKDFLFGRLQTEDLVSS